MYNRRSIRLDNYNYTDQGAYFITVCALVRQPWFGNVCDGIMQLNKAGEMVTAEWRDIPVRFPHCALDICVLMPDHLHGIIALVSPTNPTSRGASGQLNGTITGSIGRIIQAFKSLTTNAYIRGVNQYSWPPFHSKLWQRNYYERIIRSEQELQHTREYILHNPLRWKQPK